MTNKTLTAPVMTTPVIDGATVPTISGTAPLYLPRAWVMFVATGTPTISGSGNVSSITDGGTGRFTVNFTTAMPDANYAAIANYNSGNTGSGTNNDGQASCYAHATGSVAVGVNDGSGSAEDPTYCSVIVMR